jgi:hypothetical protein
MLAEVGEWRTGELGNGGTGKPCSWGTGTVTETYVYAPEILEELARHGLRPTPKTPPQQLRDAVRDLYKYEIKRLRTDLLANRIRKADYAACVVQLRRRYPLLSVPLQFWTAPCNLRG